MLDAIARVRAGAREPRRHRQRDEARLRLPDGSAVPHRLRRASTRRTTSATSCSTSLSEERFAAPPPLRRMVPRGLHGRKTGKGFYDWSTNLAVVSVGIYARRSDSAAPGRHTTRPDARSRAVGRTWLSLSAAQAPALFEDLVSSGLLGALDGEARTLCAAPRNGSVSRSTRACAGSSRAAGSTASRAARSRCCTTRRCRRGSRAHDRRTPRL